MDTENLQKVLSKPLDFKTKLAIGEDAYTSLKTGKNLQKAWDAFGMASTGAAIAKTGFVASMIGTKTGALAIIGVGTLATPLPYIALAAAGSTALYFGVMSKVRNFSSDRVVTIPKFINTPLDLLAVSLFDLLAPVLFKMCQVDGSASDEEIELIEEYFVEDWGYNKEYFQQCASLILDQIDGKTVEELLIPLVDYIKENPDCNQVKIATDILSILKEVAEIDGHMHPEEIAFLENASKIICGEPLTMSSLVGRVKSSLSGLGDIPIPKFSKGLKSD